MREYRDRSKLCYCQLALRASLMGATAHPPTWSHRKLPQRRKESPSEHPQRAVLVQLLTEIKSAAFLEATDDDGKPLQLLAALSQWAAWHIRRQKERHYCCIIASPEPYSHRAIDTSVTGLTTRRAKGFVTCDIHHSRDFPEIPFVRMLNGCQRLQAAVPKSPSPFVMRVSCTICITEFGQRDICNTLEALPVVVLLEEPIGQPHEHLLLVVGLNQETIDSNTLASCLLRHQSSSRRSTCKYSFHLAPCLGCENLGWMRLHNVFQLLPGSPRSLRLVLMLQLLHQVGAGGGPSGSKGAHGRFCARSLYFL